MIKYSQTMVFIKMTQEMWVLSGLEKVIPTDKITMIDNNRYIPYQLFKQSSKLVEHPVHTLLHRDHIIPNSQFTKLQLQSQLSPSQKQQKLQLKLKHDLRVLNHHRKMPSTSVSGSDDSGLPASLNAVRSDAYYFEEKKDESIKDMSKSLSFGMTFIFSFFMAGLTGYYVGTYFLGLSFEKALIISVLFIMATIVIETTLFIIKQNRDDKIKAWKSKEMYKQQFVKPSYSEYKRKAQKHKQELEKMTSKPKTQ